MTTAASTPAGKTGAMREGRQADSARRRQRVLAALDKAAAGGEEISVAGIARAAAVDRTFLYPEVTSAEVARLRVELGIYGLGPGFVVST